MERCCFEAELDEKITVAHECANANCRRRRESKVLAADEVVLSVEPDAAPATHGEAAVEWVTKSASVGQPEMGG
jgi:hypothetical protein